MPHSHHTGNIFKAVMFTIQASRFGLKATPIDSRTRTYPSYYTLAREHALHHYFPSRTDQPKKVSGNSATTSESPARYYTCSRHFEIWTKFRTPTENAPFFARVKLANFHTRVLDLPRGEKNFSSLPRKSRDPIRQDSDWEILAKARKKVVSRTNRMWSHLWLETIFLRNRNWANYRHAKGSHEYRPWGCHFG